MEVKPYDRALDEKYCSCRGRSFATIVHGEHRVSLCQDCYEDFLDSIEEFSKTIFCKDCRYYRASLSDIDHGTCLKSLEHIFSYQKEFDGMHDLSDLTPEMYGIYFPTDSLRTCENAANNKEEE